MNEQQALELWRFVQERRVSQYANPCGGYDAACFAPEDLRLCYGHGETPWQAVAELRGKYNAAGVKREGQ